MQFSDSIHLGYSTNIHRGNTWAETFTSLKEATLSVRQQVCPLDKPYGIGLRLSNSNNCTCLTFCSQDLLLLISFSF